MVALLTATLIFGVLTIVVVLVIRIATETGPGPMGAVGADAVSLPAGETIIATGASASALTIATRDAAGAERMRVFDPTTGEQVGEVAITRN